MFPGCPSGWYKFGGDCYRTFSNAGGEAFNNSYSARKLCQDQGADLPSITSQNVSIHINNVVRKLAKPAPPRRLYVGVSDYDTEGTFVFVNGKILMGYDNVWENGKQSLALYTVDPIE